MVLCSHCLTLPHVSQVMVERQGGGRVWYTKQQIHACMAKVVAVDLGQRVQVRAGSCCRPQRGGGP